MYVETKIASIIYAVTTRAIRMAVERNSKKYTYRYIDGVGRGGKKLLIEVDEVELGACVDKGEVDADVSIYEALADGSLGEVIWSAFNKRATEENLEKKVSEEVPPKAVQKATKPPVKDEIKYFQLTDEQKEQAQERLKLLKDWEAAKRAGMSIDKFVQNRNVVEPALKLNKQKLYRWQRAYKAKGNVGLADMRGVARKGTSKLSEWQREYVLTQFRAFGAGEFNFQQLWDALHEEAGRRGEIDYMKFLRAEVKPLHDYGTVKRFIENYYEDKPLEYAMITLGEDKAKSYFQPAMGNQKENIVHRNQCWQVDSSPSDVMCRDGEDGQAFRPNILSIVDVYTGRSVMSLDRTSSALSLVRLMWKAFEKFGKPNYIKGDNGKDYLSKQFQELLNGLGIEYDRAIAYAGDEKGYVERHFRTVQHAGMSFTPGWLGGNLATREKIEQRTPKRNRKAKDKYGHIMKTNQEHLITFEQLKLKLDAEVMKWDVMKVRRKGNKEAPIDIWNADETPIKPVAFEEFILYAGGSTLRTVAKKGIAYEAVHYVGDAMPPVGTKVVVRENIDNKQEIFVYDLMGNFLCRAFDKNIACMTAEQYKAVKKIHRGKMTELRKIIKSAEFSAFTKLNIEMDYQIMEQLHRETLKAENFDSSNDDVVKATHKKIEEQRAVDAIKTKVFDVDSIKLKIPSNNPPKAKPKLKSWDDMDLDAVKFG